MNESVILRSPLLLALYGLALAMDLISLVKKTGFFLHALSAFIVIAASACALPS